MDELRLASENEGFNFRGRKGLPALSLALDAHPYPRGPAQGAWIGTGGDFSCDGVVNGNLGSFRREANVTRVTPSTPWPSGRRLSLIMRTGRPRLSATSA